MQRSCLSCNATIECRPAPETCPCGGPLVRATDHPKMVVPRLAMERLHLAWLRSPERDKPGIAHVPSQAIGQRLIQSMRRIRRMEELLVRYREMEVVA